MWPEIRAARPRRTIPASPELPSAYTGAGRFSARISTARVTWSARAARATSAPVRTTLVSAACSSGSLSPAFFEFGFDVGGAAGDVRHDTRATRDDLIEGWQPVGSLEFDRGANRGADFLDLLRKPIGKEQPLREFGHARQVPGAERLDAVDPRQEPIGCR